jgi:hypothetical protein
VSHTYWPTPLLPGGAISSGLAAANLTFDSANDRLAWVGPSPVTDTLLNLYFRLGNTVTGCDLDIRAESASNGRPSGSLLAANTNDIVTVANTDDNVWKTATFDSPPSWNRGTEYALVMAVSSGTPNMNVGIPPAALVGAWQSHYPLILQDTGGGTWAQQSAGYGLAWIARFQNAGVVPLGNLCPIAAGTLTTFNSGSSPNERLMRFQLSRRRRVLGVRVALFNIAAGAEHTFSIWPASSSTDSDALAQVTFDGDSVISPTLDGYIDLWFPSSVVLEAATTYYSGDRANNTNNADFVTYANADVANALLALPGMNAQTYLSTRTWSGGTAGATSDTTTSVPLHSLIIDDSYDGGSGGGMLQGNLRGNMQ